MAFIFLKAFGTERELPSLESAGVEIAGFSNGGGFLGQEIVGIGAKRRDGERLMSPSI
jgi:hypothetical protein